MVVRMTDLGQQLEAVQIVNSRLAPAEVITRPGEHPKSFEPRRSDSDRTCDSERRIDESTNRRIETVPVMFARRHERIQPECGMTAVGTRPIRAGQRRPLQMPTASVYRAADVDDVGELRVVAVALQVDDRGCLHAPMFPVLSARFRR